MPLEFIGFLVVVAVGIGSAIAVVMAIGTVFMIDDKVEALQKHLTALDSSLANVAEKVVETHAIILASCEEDEDEGDQEN